ncbi:hypothetical protein T08_10902 [Trichinella sp. T8]|nr:hypothetical protein T08_10902 [Trichinella sp. T8]
MRYSRAVLDCASIKAEILHCPACPGQLISSGSRLYHCRTVDGFQFQTKQYLIADLEKHINM